MVSLKDIAAACGVSTATVSKALNGQKDISEKTKKLICDKASEMGYLPNTAARALKTGRTHNIGVLFMDEAGSGLTHNYFALMLDAIKRKVEEEGYDITFINSSSKGRKLSYLEHARSRHFDGVIIACIRFDSPEVAELAQSEIPVVTIDYVFNNCTAVMSNNTKGIEDLLKYIASLGHRKIAYIHGADSAVTRNRIISFRRTAEALGLDIPEEYLLEAPYRSIKESHDMTLKLLNMKDPPTCILYPDDFASLGGRNAIRELGLRIPEDISIAGYDGIRISLFLEPTLTTVQQDTEEIGKVAAERLIALIEKPQTTLNETVVIDGKILKGQSVRRIGQTVSMDAFEAASGK